MHNRAAMECAEIMVTTAAAARQRAASFTEDDVAVIVARPDVGSEAVSASAQLLSDRERARVNEERRRS